MRSSGDGTATDAERQGSGRGAVGVGGLRSPVVIGFGIAHAQTRVVDAAGRVARVDPCDPPRVVYMVELHRGAPCTMHHLICVGAGHRMLTEYKSASACQRW
jgi:hypothetical protein